MSPEMQAVNPEVEALRPMRQSWYRISLGKGRLLKLQGWRFGRRYVPFATMLRNARTAVGLSAEELSVQLGKEKAFVSKLETSKASKRRLVAFETILHIALALHLDPLEAFVAYECQRDPLLRVVAYPDDPGPMGGEAGVPRPGLDLRLAARAESER